MRTQRHGACPPLTPSTLFRCSCASADTCAVLVRSEGGVRAALAFQGDVSSEANAIDMLIAAHEFIHAAK
jgi:hypothetical protein